MIIPGFGGGGSRPAPAPIIIQAPPPAPVVTRETVPAPIAQPTQPGVSQQAKKKKKGGTAAGRAATVLTGGTGVTSPLGAEQISRPGVTRLG
jgi:hypothetical protein